MDKFSTGSFTLINVGSHGFHCLCKLVVLVADLMACNLSFS